MVVGGGSPLNTDVSKEQVTFSRVPAIDKCTVAGLSAALRAFCCRWGTGFFHKTQKSLDESYA